MREAEQDLIAANANVGVAKANFFPTISLSGLLGGVSPQLSELTGAGKAWSLAGNLAGPLFTAGRLKNEYRAALAQRDQAKISFEKAVTGAFGEVSISLSAHQELAEAYRKQMASVDAYRESIRLSTIRYDSGLASYLEIIDAEIQMYPAETATVTYDLGRKVALVNLYRALGGGWNLSECAVDERRFDSCCNADSGAMTYLQRNRSEEPRCRFSAESCRALIGTPHNNSIRVLA